MPVLQLIFYRDPIASHHLNITWCNGIHIDIAMMSYITYICIISHIMDNNLNLTGTGKLLKRTYYDIGSNLINDCNVIYHHNCTKWRR